MTRPIQKLLVKFEKALRLLGLTMLTQQSPAKYKPYSLTIDFKKNTLTSDRKQFFRLQSILKENPELHSGTPTLGYVIAILKEIEALSRAKIPNRKILVVLAGQEQITDNVAVMQLTNRYAFMNVETIEKAQHEILIEKDEIRVEALSLMHKFLKS